MSSDNIHFTIIQCKTLRLTLSYCGWRGVETHSADCSPLCLYFPPNTNPCGKVYAWYIFAWKSGNKIHLYQLTAVIHSFAPPPPPSLPQCTKTYVPTGLGFHWVSSTNVLNPANSLSRKGFHLHTQSIPKLFTVCSAHPPSPLPPPPPCTRQYFGDFHYLLPNTSCSRTQWRSFGIIPLRSGEWASSSRCSDQLLVYLTRHWYTWERLFSDFCS